MSKTFGTGILATLAAMAATTLAAALARALGVDFEVEAGETIPLSGIAFITGVFAMLGVVLAAALQRWTPRPAEHFVRTAIALTTFSLVPPVLVDADAATTATLIGLHLIAAAVMISALVRALRRPVGEWPRSAGPSTATRVR